MEFLDTTIVFIGHIHVARAVYSDCYRITELALAAAETNTIHGMTYPDILSLQDDLKCEITEPERTLNPRSDCFYLRILNIQLSGQSPTRRELFITFKNTRRALAREQPTTFQIVVPVP